MTPGDRTQTIGLIVSGPVGKRMAGPAIRYWEFARILADHFQVRLMIPPHVPQKSVSLPEQSPVELYPCGSNDELRAAAQDCDILVTVGAMLYLYSFLRDLNKILVLDLYHMLILEDMELSCHDDLATRLNRNEQNTQATRFNLRAGDFFLCASEKQRDYWLGALTAAGRINPYTHGQDPSFRKLIDVVPFGLPAQSAVHTKPVLKGIHDHIESNDKVIVWNGGIWNWFDAPTLVRAMPIILEKRDDVKLFFMGIKHPNSAIPLSRLTQETIDLSKQLGLYDRQVIFNDWVAYHERQNYLLEADVAVSLHSDHLETRFSFRTRMLDCLWTGLPVVATRGDLMGEILAEYDLARLVPPHDEGAVAREILDLLARPNLRAECEAKAERFRPQYRWQSAARPLLEYCLNPQPAADREYLSRQPLDGQLQVERMGLAEKAWRAIRLGGPQSLVSQTEEYLRWKLRQWRGPTRVGRDQGRREGE